MSARQPKSTKARNLKLTAHQAKSVKGGIALLLPAVQKIREGAASKK
jgi:hypothetical protein